MPGAEFHRTDERSKQEGLTGFPGRHVARVLPYDVTAEGPTLALVESPSRWDRRRAVIHARWSCMNALSSWPVSSMAVIECLSEVLTSGAAGDEPRGVQSTLETGLGYPKSRPIRRRWPAPRSGRDGGCLSPPLAPEAPGNCGGLLRRIGAGRTPGPYARSTFDTVPVVLRLKLYGNLGGDIFLFNFVKRCRKAVVSMRKYLHD